MTKVVRAHEDIHIDPVKVARSVTAIGMKRRNSADALIQFPTMQGMQRRSSVKELKLAAETKISNMYAHRPLSGIIEENRARRIAFGTFEKTKRLGANTLLPFEIQ